MAELVERKPQDNKKETKEITLDELYSVIVENNRLIKEQNVLLNKHSKTLDDIMKAEKSFGDINNHIGRWGLFYLLTLVADTIRGKPL